MTIEVNEDEIIEMLGEEEYHGLVEFFANRLRKLANKDKKKYAAETGSIEVEANEFKHLIYTCTCQILPIGVDFGFTKMYLSTEVSPDEYLDMYNKLKSTPGAKFTTEINM